MLQLCVGIRTPAPLCCCFRATSSASSQGPPGGASFRSAAEDSAGFASTRPAGGSGSSGRCGPPLPFSLNCLHPLPSPALPSSLPLPDSFCAALLQDREPASSPEPRGALTARPAPLVAAVSGLIRLLPPSSQQVLNRLPCHNGFGR